MEQLFLGNLIKISQEEQEILCSKAGVNKSIYTSSRNFIIEYENLLKDKPIDVRLHTRFVDFPIHSHNYMEIMFVFNGSITHIINGEKICLNKGDMLFMNRHVAHSVMKAEKDDIGINFILSDNFLNSVWLNLKEELLLKQFLDENFKKNGSPEYLHFRLGDIYPIINIVNNLLFSLLSKDRKDSSLLPQLVSLLLEYVSLNEQALVHNTHCLTKEQRLKREISKYLMENYKTASLKSLARKYNFSQEYLSRLILKMFGKNFRSLLIDQRILVAEKLLVSTSMSISDIVNAIGYENKSYFHHVFLSTHQMTPHAWRQKHK